MPKENKNARGRRDEKRKRNQDGHEEHQTKRQKFVDLEENHFLGADNDKTLFPGEAVGSTERPFFGMLEEEEQEYFRRADELLELNDFPTDEERHLFLENVYREAEGKELKIANSQSCSRLMERLILLSTPRQKKKLFGVFSGQFLHLVQHRFASHCCESLFIHSAPVVTSELLGGVEYGEDKEASGQEEVFVSMENMFLYTLNELEGHMALLLTDRFASHVLRVLLIVLSGQPLGKASTRSLLQSKQKQKVGITGLEIVLSLEKRIVPESFQFAVQKIIADTIVGLDSTFIHVLTTHPTGNPTLQLLLELELTQSPKNSDEKTILRTLLPDDLTIENSKSAAFINGLIYDTLGSRLLETIIRFSPGKLFKSIYRSIFRDRMGALSRNEIASFVVICVIERLSKEDLEVAVEGILPQISSLVERNRTNIIKVLLERCQARNTTKSIVSLTKAIEEAYGPSPTTMIMKMTCLTPESFSIEHKSRSSPATAHGSLLAQSMLSISGPPSAILQAGLLALPPSTLLNLGLINTASHILQTAFTVPQITASTNSTDTLLSFRRKLANLLLFPKDQDEGHNAILTIATSPPGTHVLDALAIFTSSHSSLMSLKERITTVLLANESALRDDYSGRIVWRNWKCDLFRRHKSDWISKMRSNKGDIRPKSSRGQENTKLKTEKENHGRLNEKIQDRIGNRRDNSADNSGKTPIELAREKFAATKIKKDIKERSSGKATGANTF